VSQESDQGRLLLDGLATAATDAAKAGSEAYAAAGGTVPEFPALQQQDEGPQSAEAAQQETREAWAGLAQRAQ
tara:strand:- start:143 stop:361 length:219 start_codon:yes stop_codon:yes gene_type:complete